MKTNKFCFVFIAFLFFISCAKDSIFEGAGDGVLLKEVTADGEVYYQYTYTNADFISEEKSKFHYEKHTYNSRNQLTQSDSYWDNRIASSSSFVLEEAMKREEWVTPENTGRSTYSTFEYNRNSQLKKIVNGTNNNFSNYTYKNGRIAKRTSYHENKASVFDNYFYDNSGNLIKTERFQILPNGDSELETTTEYTFDMMHNPYWPFRKLIKPGKNTNANNIIRETYILHFEVDDFIEPVQTTEYQYEYNSNGYPVKRSDGFEYLYY